MRPRLTTTLTMRLTADDIARLDALVDAQPAPTTRPPKRSTVARALLRAAMLAAARTAAPRPRSTAPRRPRRKTAAKTP
jgi:hypothetical protein